MAAAISCLVLALALALAGCRDEPRSMPSPVRTVQLVSPGDAAAVHASDAASDAAVDATRDAAVDATIAAEPGPGDVELTGDHQVVHLRWGRAFYGSEGFIVQLYSMPKGCEHFSPLDDDFTGSLVQLTVLPGPGGTFYTGQRFGTTVLVKSDVIPLVLYPPQVELRIEPFRTGKGQHIRGTIAAATHTLVGTAKLDGRFDVEICDGPDTPIRALRATAPARPVRGRLAGQPLVPRTVHAIVRAYPASKHEVVDLAAHRRTRGSINYVSWFMFYAAPNVPCPRPEDDAAARPAPLFELYNTSGTSAARPILHAPQPIDGMSGKQPWTGWITFDRLAFTDGGYVTGTLWAQPSFAWSPKGELGGRFRAKVCVE